MEPTGLIIGRERYDRMKEVIDFDNSKIGVKGLSDSGITTIPKFFVHPPETLSDLKKSSSFGSEIPVIDLSNLHCQTNREKIIKEVREAAKTWGFFQVINHGIPLGVLDDIILAIKAFHEEPKEAKAKYYLRGKGNGVRLVSNVDLLRSKAACWRDTLNVWMPVQAEEIPEVCRREVLEWDAQTKKVAEVVMDLLSEGMGLESGKLVQLGCLSSRVILGHCYPHCPQPDSTLGLNSHTDVGTLAVLVQNQVAGLQVKHGEYWVDVNPVPGGLIVNIGDLLQIISNGNYNSFQHRVLANASKELRISVGQFFSLDNSNECACFGPLPELVSPDKPALYRSFTIRDFNENFYSKELDSKSLVEKLRI
ncbi:1-aminocyclopropane-1-carboxylate oxidase homolog 4-like [Diospyros lotus]|uniref:1-aminocyclopropane-1-carboxylate oxidase homolog 4-like n=1 Tax=Diospyros lotus TaxID=55363 RepID=UPI002252DB24|nr:1-aminocyclopropane-1-carboxylate oxidase homolog 4-like [Diospyros lotus]XP_052172787.1 1-aminocyclopropane-1-carboxylate oxidase homolog 4-like [Diospyros lotus]XP_052172788.1 1-aminocyclopropane-1-carboxylate oxidase homolog 4-like [Diospyros lotus]XP_052172789.1 1-aminocyclopropane-1-carboxylate oxidase homolog 4-like [Diospyros lotus]